MAISKRITTFVKPFWTQSTTYREGLTLSKQKVPLYMNLCGYYVKQDRMGSFGYPMSWCMAEDEEACLRVGWEPYHVRMGFEPKERAFANYYANPGGAKDGGAHSLKQYQGHIRKAEGWKMTATKCRRCPEADMPQ